MFGKRQCSYIPLKLQPGVELFLTSLLDLAMRYDTTSACLKDALLGLIDVLSIETGLTYFSIECALQALRKFITWD